MKKLILATGVDEKYYNTDIFNNYVSSIIKNSNFNKNFIFVVDHNVDITIFNNIEIKEISSKDISCLPNNKCLQHGEFIKSNNLSDTIQDEDIIVFTDGDMTLQRNLKQDEILFLHSLKDNDVYVGYNASPEDTLSDEYYRLTPTKPHNEIFNIDISKIKIYNTGVLCMNKKTWEKLSKEYIKLFPWIDTLLTHYAKQQWLICFIIGTMGYNIIEMPYDIHNHTHYPSPEGTNIDENGIVSFKGDVVLFKHRWF
jgi:calcineurin-like phosphoesterase family protein